MVCVFIINGDILADEEAFFKGKQLHGQGKPTRIPKIWGTWIDD